MRKKNKKKICKIKSAILIDLILLDLILIFNNINRINIFIKNGFS